MVVDYATEKNRVLEVLQQVPDPEIPVLSILDLGVVRDILLSEEEVTVVVTPTYSGCPATEVIAQDIKQALVDAGWTSVRIETQLSPAWTTDWISEAGRKKLLAYGIVPPVEPGPDASALFAKPPVIPCPQCQSRDTRLVSQFGSTPCKAQYQCNQCLEPFDYFKCLK